MKLTVKNVEEKTIRRIAHEYLSGSYVTLKNLGTKYGSTATTISNILWKGIAENIIDSKVARYVYNKIVDKPSIGWYQRKLRWDEAFEKRDKLLKERDQIAQELKILYSKKEYYESLLSSYEEYFFEDEGCPSREELTEALEEVKRQIFFTPKD